MSCFPFGCGSRQSWSIYHPDSDCTGEVNHDSSSGVASDTPSYYQRSAMSTFKGDSGSDCVMSSDRSSASTSSLHQILKLRNDVYQGRTPPTSLSHYTPASIKQRAFTSSTPNLNSDTSVCRTQRHSSASTPLSHLNKDVRHSRGHDKDKLLASLKMKHPHLVPYFSYLSDSVIIRILSHLPSNQLCQCACVCKRWYGLAWDLSLWRVIRINSETINVDRAVKYLTKRLSYETPGVCAIVEKINLNGCEKLTNRGLRTIARRCSELRHLEVKHCANISNSALFDVVSYCTNLEYLDVAGCPCITSVSLTEAILAQNSPKHMKQIYLRYLDMTDCYSLDDEGLKTIATHCTQLEFIYLRRCVRITDIGIQFIANNCCFLREFSISDCKKVTDFALKELSKLESNLRYLSIAKCDKISDVGVKYVANFCVKLRYMNLRGCEAVSDDSLEFLAQNCPRLRSLDIGKCDVTDDGLEGIAENCPQLRKLSVKSCDAITDVGIKKVASHCHGLQQLNIQDCNVTVDAYRTVKKFCKKCIIEHTNPGFY